MDELNMQEHIDGNHGMFESRNDSCGYVYEHGQGFINLMKYSLLLGAEKLLMTRKSPEAFASSRLETCNINGDYSYEEVRKREGKGAMHFDECSLSSSTASIKGIERMDKYVQISDVIDCSSNFYNEFPLDFVAFLRILTVLVLKLAGFQFGLFVRFITFPIQLLNFWLTILMLPFQVLVLARENLKKRLQIIWSNSCFSLMYFICGRFKLQKSVLKLAVRFGWACFWSVYVCLILVGLLVVGFVIGGITMKHLVIEPIQTTENLNFDYTKTSPVAFVPVTSSPVAGVSPGLISKERTSLSKNVGGRAIPYDHKLQLTVSLTMPESEYNRNLGIFQVRVECLSSDGNVTASSSYPSMLHFKSQPIRFVETIFNSIPLLTGFQSEVQNLKIGVIDFTEGYEPTACFKVIIEQRAEYGPGFGIPEIYAATLHIESQLPQLKRIIWNWRRTIFVWISMISFLTELAIALICCRPIILPGRTILKVISAKGESRVNKISW